MWTAKGDWINGQWVEASAAGRWSSINPVDGSSLLEVGFDVGHVAAACEGAAQAYKGWSALGRAARWEHLVRLRDVIAARSASLAEAIRLETGKVQREAEVEVRGLISRFDAVRGQVEAHLKDGPLPGFAHEQLYHHPHGVVGVLGPFNFPIHLCHVHVLPALLLGNTVVLKPSEVTPLCGQRYAEAFEEAGFPRGVFQMVQGPGATGAAISQHSAVRGLCFTGAYETGRRIQGATLDRPELLLALEMGGKNVAVVLDDADVRQAIHEVAVGGYLTTGQRCTATDRVLVSRNLLNPLLDGLKKVLGALQFGDPTDPKSFAGPMTTARGRQVFNEALARARAGGAQAVIEGGPLEGGLFQRPSIHLLPDGCHALAGYTDAELFGPDLCVEVIDSDEEAIAVMNASPFGLSNTVFTADRARFSRIQRETWSGLLNWNRTTNQASPRLPFGGVGRSGNFRPAGSGAPLNLVFPMATQENLLGEFNPDPMIAPSLPPIDLGALETQHSEEEAQERIRDLVRTPRPMGTRLPKGGALPQSEAWLQRLYVGDRVVKEKKPCVVDHMRSAGPWMVSVDDAPLSVLDAMSQTATVCAGFCEDSVARAYIEGAFGDSALRCPDTSWGGPHPEVEAYAETLRALVPGLAHVSFTSSGAEANEKAYALCMSSRPHARRLLAFEGSFHGRTLLALHASFNPAKRAPFELPGYEVTFAPFPVWGAPCADADLPLPDGWAQALSGGHVQSLNAPQDPLLAAELASLRFVDAALSLGDYFAVDIEPMQSEGGDRYASPRFLRALRLLTRRHDVPLIFDEVQVGFGLGGDFVWSQGAGLIDRDGAPDLPDAIVFAKRAQVGVCVSRFEDPEPTSAHTASLVRGLLHAASIGDGARAKQVEAWVQPLLAEAATRFPQLVGNPRAQGYAVAFDLPTPALLNAYIGQRFWRGAVVFAAGDRTVRYRLNSAFGPDEIKKLFTRVCQSLAWLEAHPHKQPPAWEDFDAPHKRSPVADAASYRVREATKDEADALIEEARALEARVYEPARRDSVETLSCAFRDADGVAVIAEHQDPNQTWSMVGFALAAPLEQFTYLDGPEADPMCGRDNTLYSISLTLDAAHSGKGLGRSLKSAQVEAARARRNPDGTPRYSYLTGRNRVGKTHAMTKLNRSLGAHTVATYDNQYGEQGVQALYYRIPLRGYAPDAAIVEPPTSRDLPLNAGDGLSAPLSEPPSSLLALERGGVLAGPTLNKLTLCNYVTPGVVRAVEWVGALTSDLPHMFLTSSRDETFDKSLRMLRYHRKAGRVAIGLRGGYMGHTTAAARSLSDPSVHRQGPAYFHWPLLPHPAEVGPEATLSALRDAVNAAGGPDAVLGLYVEPLQERTGRTLPATFWEGLQALRRDLNIPVVTVETASACYRSGLGPFISPTLPFTPDLMTWWGGGQGGFVHTTTRYNVPSPLTMVSTWDGDELSLTRIHHQLRAARLLDLSPAIAATAQAIAASPLPAHGLGLYWVIEAGTRSADLKAACDREGLTLRPLPQSRWVFAPPLDLAPTAARRLERALKSL
jgi:RHH-type transcriptional regulator, proline utilization regulon repressor / proline dehydrogenase / delta 1-pyrroline-5-carboxylate dehydrogenase